MKQLSNIAILILAFLVSSCKHDTVTNSISYPAAYIVNSGDNSIAVINLNTNTLVDKILLPNCNFPYHVYISPDHKLLAVSVVNHDLSNGFPSTSFNNFITGNKILIIDAISKNVVKEIPLPQIASNAIFSYYSNELWVGQADDIQSKMLVFDVADWTLKKTILLGRGLTDITFCSDGDMSFTCTSTDDSVQMYTVNGKLFLMKSHLPSHPVGAYPSDHHTDFIVCDGNNTVYEVNADDCQTLDTVLLGYKPGHIKYNSAKSEMWMTDITNGKIHWFKRVLTHWTEQGAVSVGNNPRWIAFSPDETTAYVANQNSFTVTILNVSSHSILNKISIGNSPSSIAIKP